MSTEPAPSVYQQDVHNWIRDGSGHIIINAVAGSGKTTTLVGAMGAVQSGSSVLCVAFNRIIRKAMIARLPSWVNVHTFHSLGLGIMSRVHRGISISEMRDTRFADRALQVLIDAEFPKKDSDPDYRIGKFFRSLCKSQLSKQKVFYELSGRVRNLASLAKNYLKWSPSDLSDIAINHQIDYFDGLLTAARLAIDYAIEDTNDVSFDDMVFLPVHLGYVQPTYDYVFVDETQDLNDVQWELVKKVVKPTGRIVAVGDPRQAIYSFRGARSDSMGKARVELNAKEFTLPVCYRCPRVVVNLAKEYVEEILPSDKAEEGILRTITKEEVWPEIRPGDYFLSRTNAVLVQMSLLAIKNRIPSFVQGRDVGQGLIHLILESKTFTTVQLAEWLVKYEENERERLIAARRTDALEALSDKVQCIHTLCEGKRTTREVLDLIEKLFRDKDPGNTVVFSSVHRAKGLEFKRVYVAKETFRIKPDGKPSEEKNLFYVAVTRAMEELVLVVGIVKKKPEEEPSDDSE